MLGLARCPLEPQSWLERTGRFNLSDPEEVVTIKVDAAPACHRRFRYRPAWTSFMQVSIKQKSQACGRCIMKQRMLVESVGPNILNPGEGPEGAGFISVCIPSYKLPKRLFGIPVARIPKELIEPMLQSGAYIYADVDFDPPDGDPGIAANFGWYSGNAPDPVSIANLELVKPS